MSGASFNLLDEPWLLARNDDGQTMVLSIREAFGSSHRLAGLVGDLPTQEVALLRLLVAILYRALPTPMSLEQRIDAWTAWWEAQTLPLSDIDDYLERYRDRFDLLHPSTPFMQVSGLSANKTSGLGKLIGDVPDGEQYFTTRAAGGVESIDLAEAARWLVHVQAYDPSGIKSGAHGDPRVKGGKGYPIGTGWTGWCGVLIPQGRTLKETLLLSLSLNLDSAGPGRSLDRPVWERPPMTAAPEADHGEPSGTSDLLTWQVRRVRLLTEGERVTDAIITNGDAIHPRNRHQLEPHCAWRHSPSQEKIHGGQVYMPRAHDPERALWRGLPGLLPQSPVDTGRVTSGAEPFIAPAVLHWLAALVHDGALPTRFPVHLRAVGVIYGSQSSTISAVVDDRVRMRAAVFADEELRALVRDMVTSAEAAVVALGHLAVNLAAAAGEFDTDGHRDRATEVAYAALDQPFRQWLDVLGPDKGAEELARAWHDETRHILTRLSDDLIRAAGRPAWLGREVTRIGGPRHIDASLAAIWFRAALRKALPLATLPESAKVHSDALSQTVKGEQNQ